MSDEPRIWNEGSEEPFEDGLKLRDRDGDIWVQLEPMSWSCNGDDAHAVDWDSALSSAPLTEVLPEPAEAPASQPMWWGTEDGGIAAILCSSCSVLGGHDNDCPQVAPAVSPNAPEPEERVVFGSVEPDHIEVGAFTTPVGDEATRLRCDHSHGACGCGHVDTATVLEGDEDAANLVAVFVQAHAPCSQKPATPPVPVVSSAPISASAGKDTEQGCCAACSGSGSTADGPCWDCRATGHSHEGECVPKRINVAVNAETVEILARTIDRDGISLTEAVRRLIGVGDVVTTASKAEHAAVLLAAEDGTTREVVIL